MPRGRRRNQEPKDRTTLFIGGPLDGHRIPVPIWEERYYHAEPVPGSSLTSPFCEYLVPSVEYRRMRLGYDVSCVVFALYGMSADQVVEQLIKGYRNEERTLQTAGRDRAAEEEERGSGDGDHPAPYFAENRADIIRVIERWLDDLYSIF